MEALDFLQTIKNIEKKTLILWLNTRKNNANGNEGMYVLRGGVDLILS